MNLSPNTADVVFLVLEVYQEEMSGGLLMNDQNVSYQMVSLFAVRPTSGLPVQCPKCTSFKTLNFRLS